MISPVNSTCRYLRAAAGRVHGENHCSSFSMAAAGIFQLTQWLALYSLQHGWIAVTTPQKKKFSPKAPEISPKSSPNHSQSFPKRFRQRPRELQTSRPSHTMHTTNMKYEKKCLYVYDSTQYDRMITMSFLKRALR